MQLEYLHQTSSLVHLIAVRWNNKASLSAACSDALIIKEDPLLPRNPKTSRLRSRSQLNAIPSTGNWN